MSIRTLLNLILAGCLLVLWLCSTLYFNHELKRLSDDALAAETKLHMQAALAIRDYTQQQVKPFFDARPELPFEDFTVPAFAAKQTLALLYQHYPDHQYREAALNPTNPKDKALGWEEDLIRGFRQEGAYTERVQVLRSEDGLSMHAVKPIRINNSACLRCHGAVQDAPPALLARYPGLGGFGWQMGEVVGVQIVTVPQQDHFARSESARDSFNRVFLGILVALFALLNVLLRFFVLKPMQLDNYELKFMASTDALTQIANRRAFDKGLAQQLALAKDSKQPLCILLLDIDFFKAVNDEFGHGVGDTVLQKFALEMSKKFRMHDLFARFGGEEFIAMLPSVSLEEATLRAKSLCQFCAQLDFGLNKPLTISVGVAQWDGAETALGLIERCDSALYRAKHSGRQHVEVAS